MVKGMKSLSVGPITEFIVGMKFISSTLCW